MNPNKFLTLLMGECWHVFKKKLDYDLCKLCGYRRSASWQEQYPDHLSNPLPVIKWMEKEIPEVLEGYAEDLWFKRLWDTNMQMIMAFLDLRNLVTYLAQNPSWGEKECECEGKQWAHKERWYGKGKSIVCDKCNGSGLIVHPALQYARDNKEEG
jgi:hypothetical protein